MSSEMKALTQVWRSFNSLRQFVPPAFLDRLGKDLEAYIAEAGTVARAHDRERVKRNTREASKRGLI